MALLRSWIGYNKLDRNFKVMYNQNIKNKEHDHSKFAVNKNECNMVIHLCSFMHMCFLYRGLQSKTYNVDANSIGDMVIILKKFRI